jgi:hypothetical protein
VINSQSNSKQYKEYILSRLPVSHYFSHNSSFSSQLLVEISMKTTYGTKMQEINDCLFQARLRDISSIHNKSHFETTTKGAAQKGTL